MREVELDTEDIANFFYVVLIERGYNPSEDEVNDIADIVFDYLIHKGIIEEERESD